RALAWRTASPKRASYPGVAVVPQPASSRANPAAVPSESTDRFIAALRSVETEAARARSGRRRPLVHHLGLLTLPLRGRHVRVPAALELAPRKEFVAIRRREVIGGQAQLAGRQRLHEPGRYHEHQLRAIGLELAAAK